MWYSPRIARPEPKRLDRYAVHCINEIRLDHIVVLQLRKRTEDEIVKSYARSELRLNMPYGVRA
jgi:hypothetical protein